MYIVNIYSLQFSFWLTSASLIESKNRGILLLLSFFKNLFSPSIRNKIKKKFCNAPPSLPVTFWKLKFSGKCVSNILLWHTLDINWVSYLSRGLSRWLRGKELAFQCRRCGFDSWVWKITWEVFLPGKSHGQRSLVGYSAWDCKRVRNNWVNKQQQIYLEGFLSEYWTCYISHHPCIHSWSRNKKEEWVEYHQCNSF